MSNWQNYAGANNQNAGGGGLATQNQMYQMAAQAGWTPQQFEDWMKNPANLTTQGMGGPIYDLSIKLGMSPEQAQKNSVGAFQNYGNWEQQQNDLNADHGMGTFLTLLALGVGGGALAAGGLGAGASATALQAGAGGAVDLGAMGGVAGGGFGTVAPGAASGLGAGSGSLAGIDPSYFSDFGSNFNSTGGNMFAPTSDSGLAGGGWTAADGSFGQGGGSLLDTLKGYYNNTFGQLPPGGSTAIQKAAGGLMGGSGSGTGTGTGGTGGGMADWLTGTGTNTLGGLASGLLQMGAYDDAGDYLKNQQERAISASDPYGYGPYRTYAAQQLQRSYQDPVSIWNSPEMQAWDTEMQNSQMARDSQAGQLFNAPERLAQRERGFLTQLKDYRAPLMQMSGSQFRPDVSAYTSLADDIVKNNIAESASLGGTINAGLGGLGSILGGSGGTGSTLSSLWKAISGGSGGGSAAGSTAGAISPELVNSINSNGSWDQISDLVSSSDGWNLGDAWGW